MHDWLARGPSRGDWAASLVVFIVAIPLSLGIALASGVPPAAAVIAAILGGIVVGALAGAPLVVSGPAAGLSALVLQIILEHGFIGLGIATVLCGIFQFVFGIFRLGGIISRVPRPVLEGMLGAIGAIILIGQLHILMGGSVPKSPFLAIQTLGAQLKSVVGAGSDWVAPVFAFGLCALAIQVLWSKLLPRWKWIPAALPAVILVTLASLPWELPRVEMAPILPFIGEQTSRWLETKWFELLPSLALSGLGLAIVASAESLLTARAVENLVPGKPTRLDRELIAQGAGNTLSGLLGGMPVTGVIVRSAVNVSSGATSRWATILHGAWVALFVIALPFLINSIPLAALASVLVLTGIKLLNLGQLWSTLKTRRFDGIVWVSTIALIMATDLLKGLVLSLAIYVVGRTLLKWLRPIQGQEASA